MILIAFGISIILCIEIIFFLNIKITLKKLIKLYSNILSEINNEEIFLNLSKEILYNSIKLFTSLLMSLAPMILFFLYIKINYDNIYNLLSYYNITLSIVIFFTYYFVRNKFVKRKL